MDTVSLILYLHIMATVVLFAVQGVELLMLYRSEQTPSAELVPAIRPLAAGSAITLLLTGIWLTTRMTAWHLAWADTALAALLVLGILGGMAARGAAAVRRVSLGLRIGLLAGVILIMTAKPGLTICLTTLLSFAAAGLLLVSRILKPAPQLLRRERATH